MQQTPRSRREKTDFLPIGRNPLFPPPQPIPTATRPVHAPAQDVPDAQTDAMREAERYELHFFPPLEELYVTSWFGEIHDITGIHRGTDFRTETGVTRVYATERGIVTMADLEPTDRRISETRSSNLRIDHGNGWESRYLHMDSFAVRERQKVYRGQFIGIAGERGSPGQPHLHFEIRRNNIPLNPEHFFGL